MMSSIANNIKLIFIASLLIVCVFTIKRVPAIALSRQTSPSTSVKLDQSSTVTSSEDYRIGPSDVIDVQIDKAPELSGTFRVGADGSIPMHYLGRINAGQKTIEELSNLIAEGLRDRYLVDPHVTITVKQYNSRSFFVQGSVRSPGVYQIEGRPSLLKIITIAGGLTENHGSTAFIIRQIKTGSNGLKPEAEKNTGQMTVNTDDSFPIANAQSRPTPTASGMPQPEPKYDFETFNINGLFRGSFEQKQIVEPGDIINIPPSDVFFVAGEVNAPGSFPLKDGTTLRQAVSLAQGTTFKAASGRALIFREDSATGKRKELPVDIAAVMSGKKEDMIIMPNDIIIVPNSRFKSVGSALLSAFGMNAARLPLRY